MVSKQQFTGLLAIRRPHAASAHALACAAVLFSMAFQAQVHAQGIYTCVLPNGRKITADRPVPECAEREQKELNTSGTLRRVVKPVMTAQEQAAADKIAREESEERLRQAEEKRKDRAMLSRYPNPPVHDMERNIALGSVEDVIKAAAKRITELGAQRKTIDQELEFYKKDPSKVPASLKRQIEDYELSVATQKQFIGTQDLEKKRINQRFDAELVRLRQLWALQSSVPAAAQPSIARAPSAAAPLSASKGAGDSEGSKP